MICGTTFKLIQEIKYESNFYPSALAFLDANLFVGLTHMNEEMAVKTQPESGNILKYFFDGAEITLQ